MSRIGEGLGCARKRPAVVSKRRLAARSIHVAASCTRIARSHRPGSVAARHVRALGRVPKPAPPWAVHAQAETALRASEAVYRSLLDHLDQMVFLKGCDFRFAVVNRQFCQDLQRSKEQVIGKTDFDFYPEHLAEKYRADDHLVLGEDRSLDREEERTVQGQRRTVRVVKTPVRDDRGQIIGVLGVFWDVTQERTLESQLRQAQKMEAIGRLAGGVAHDFNNLLTIIIGYADILYSNLPPDDPQRLLVKEIRGASERAAMLTRQLLAFSRKQILQPVVLDVNAVVSNMEGMLRPLLGDDIDLTFVPAPELHPVQADPGQLDQVLMNLAVNARDAMPRGGELTIRTSNAVLTEKNRQQRPEIQPGYYVLIEVSDTGCGMDEATMARIFEPFFTTKKPGEGTGLGLPVVYGIVKQSGGHIFVFSNPGRGSTFQVYLPRHGGAAAVPESSPPNSSAMCGGTETLLLVEDDECVRSLSARVLRTCGYTVLEAQNGREALVAAAGHSETIDLLVSDVVMPQMGGPELARRLVPRHPRMEVLYLSGCTAQDLSRYGVSLESTTVLLHKPFSATTLARKVRDLLDSRQPRHRE